MKKITIIEEGNQKRNIKPNPPKVKKASPPPAMITGKKAER